MVSLYNLGLLVANGGVVGGADGGGGSTTPPTGLDGISSAPIAVQGGISAGGLTSGPNFTIGRRTWTDLVPQ